jgi:hypothetical protein
VTMLGCLEAEARIHQPFQFDDSIVLTFTKRTKQEDARTDRII